MGKREKMSRKLDAWLGRGFKAYKLKSLLDLAVARLAVLRNQRRARCDLARSDVAELLRQGHQERALLRAEYVIREQNMLDAFAMVESYCHVVAERIALLENQSGCPDELKEAIAGLLFAASRCGELHELHEARSIFASRLGKEFVAAAVELRNNCGVNARIIQKLSTKQASLESRVIATKEIAAEKGIAFHFEEPSSEITHMEAANPQPAAEANQVPGLSRDEYSSEPMKLRQKYKDAASAAQAAFESAQYAAAAARAAVELSRTESQDRGGPGEHSSPRGPARTNSGDHSSRTHHPPDRSVSGGSAAEKILPVQVCSVGSDSEEEVKQGTKPVQHSGEGNYASPAGSKRGDPLLGREKKVAYDTSDEEDDSDGGGAVGGGEFLGKSSVGSSINGVQLARAGRETLVSSDEDTSDEEVEEIDTRRMTFRQQSPARRQGSCEHSQHKQPETAVPRHRKQEEEEQEEEHPAPHPGGSSSVGNAAIDGVRSVPGHRLGMGKEPVSMRTRRSGI